MYPKSSSASSLIAPEYLPLVYRWALQILTALATIHSEGIFHMDIQSLDPYWLREDLSIALVGFMSASFVNLRGEHTQESSHEFKDFSLQNSKDKRRSEPSAKSDLFDWATLVYELMTWDTPFEDERYVDIDEVIMSRNFPKLENEKLGTFVKRCWGERYKSASDLSRDVATYLREQGVDVEGDDIRGFEYQKFL